MIQKVDTQVSVLVSFNKRTLQVVPKVLVWDGRVHKIVKVGLHHTYRRGRTLFHVFSVASNTLFFRLVFNTENLFWNLEEISDGVAQ